MDSIFSFLKYIFRYKKKTVDQIVFYVSLISAATMVVHVGYITDPEVAKLTDMDFSSLKSFERPHPY